MSTPDPSKPRGGRGRSKSKATPSGTTTDGGLGTSIAPTDDDTQSIVSAVANMDIKKHCPEQEALQALVMGRPRDGRGVGTVGKWINLFANTFAVTLPEEGQPGFKVRRYEVTIGSPAMKKMLKEEKRDVFWKMIETNTDIFPIARRTGIIYDDSAAMYTVDDMHALQFDLKLRAQFDWTMRECDFTAHFRYTQETILKLNVGGDNAVPVQILDILLSQQVRCPLFELSKSWYPYGNHLYGIPDIGRPMFDLTGGRELWSGFHDAIKLGANGGPLLNVNVAMSAFYKRTSILQFIVDLMNCDARKRQRGPKHDVHRVEDLPPSFTLQHWQVRQLKNELKGLKLHTNHMATNRTLRFNDVHLPPKEIIFDRRETVDGEETSVQSNVLDYFEEKYGRLRFPALQTLHLGSRQKTIFIPIEHLSITETVPQKVPHHKVTGEQTSNLIRQAALAAPERRERILRMLADAQITTGNDPFAASFNVGVRGEMSKLRGRLLPKPRLTQQGDDFETDQAGGWTSRFHKFHEPVQNIVYAVIVVNQQQRPTGDIERFCDALVMHSTQVFGMGFVNNRPVTIQFAPGVDQLSEAFHVVMKELDAVRGQFDAITPLVIVEMNGRDPLVYSIIKRLGEVKYGVITQCLLHGVMRRSSQGSTCQATMFNIIIKLNTKLGGTNCALVVDQVWEKMTGVRSTLFVGVDVTHPGPTESSSPSIGAVVANIDVGASKYAVSIKVQRHRREAMIYMKQEMQQRILTFYRKTGRRPDYLIVYRDGVGESEFGRVVQEELQSVRDACADCGAGYKPKITYIVVQKRHHMRFFCGDQRTSMGRAGNVPGGTVVDTIVTHPQFFDFYLVSHFGPMGTSRPAHYIVLHDDAGWSADELQACTYKLCHMFGRCAKAVSIPAPVYMAHYAATRARMHYKGATEYRGAGGGYDEGGGGGGSDTGDTEAHIQAMVDVREEIKDLPYFV